MPYSSTEQVPKYVPKAKRHDWLEVFNSAFKEQKGKGKSDEDAESYAFATANSRYGPKGNPHGKLSKATEDEKAAFLEALDKILGEEFGALPTEVRGPLETAMLSGAAQGIVQIESPKAGLIADVNTAAQNYASKRAAEMIGMKYNEDGKLVRNPDARWSISSTTRQQIRKIIADSFTEEKSLSDIKAAIRDALRKEAEHGGIFSADRASMIARSEIMRAQAGGNFTVWRDSGLVKSIRWLGALDEKECAVCMGNDNQVIKIGQHFNSGVQYPPDHPNCRCVIQVEETQP